MGLRCHPKRSSGEWGPGSATPTPPCFLIWFHPLISLTFSPGTRQDEKNQMMTTNVWLKQVRAPPWARQGRGGGPQTPDTSGDSSTSRVILNCPSGCSPSQLMADCFSGGAGFWCGQALCPALEHVTCKSHMVPFLGVSIAHVSATICRSAQGVVTRGRVYSAHFTAEEDRNPWKRAAQVSTRNPKLLLWVHTEYSMSTPPNKLSQNPLA